jgi:hypothetical protein
VRDETSDMRVQVYGDTAVVIGRLQRTRDPNGRVLQDEGHIRRQRAHPRVLDAWSQRRHQLARCSNAEEPARVPLDELRSAS